MDISCVILLLKLGNVVKNTALLASSGRNTVEVARIVLVVSSLSLVAVVAVIVTLVVCNFINCHHK